LIEVILTERFLKSTPTLTSDSHSDEKEECDGRVFSSSNRNGVGGVTYLNPLLFLS